MTACRRGNMRSVPCRAFSFGLFWGILIAVFLCGCVPTETPEKPSRTSVVERVPAEGIPDFEDDMDSRSLLQAAGQSLTFLDRIPGDRLYPLGELKIRADAIKASLQLFMKLGEAGRLDRSSLAEAFDVYCIHPQGDPHSLVTGYYEPVLDGRMRRDETFRYPLYGIPPDLVTIDLGSFDPGRFSGERLVGRLSEKKVVPYYTRAEIDGANTLDPAGCQLVWLKDPVDAFFLHVQGSGLIKLPAESRRVGYAGSNGRPYRSVGKFLIDKGLMSADGMSLQAIRGYLKAHPEMVDEVLAQNESYVFFHWVKEGPVGSVNVPLTSGRSVATDPQFHPRGALSFLETQKPILDAQGNVTGWTQLHRWVLNQDSGGAIKGPGRVDLFCGTGDSAEWTAGRLKHPGRLYFLVKKDSIEK